MWLLPCFPLNMSICSRKVSYARLYERERENTNSLLSHSVPKVNIMHHLWLIGCLLHVRHHLRNVHTLLLIHKIITCLFNNDSDLHTQDPELNWLNGKSRLIYYLFNYYYFFKFLLNTYYVLKFLLGTPILY